MREIEFLHQNSARWKKFELLLNKRYEAHPDDLAALYIEVTDDLAYAQTFYNGSRTTQYLNQLAAKVHHIIYSTKREDKSRILVFWSKELPLIFYRTRKEFLYAFLIFISAITIGVLSAAHDEGFVRVILGEKYLNMTMENIKSGEPFAVYRSMRSLDMFFGITINNIIVSFSTFIAGIALSLGTAFYLFYNGIMLGVFHYVFFQHELLQSSLLTVFIHGTLEISAIIIAGGAGMVMGNSLLFPKTYTRGYSFMKGAAQGIKIIVGLIPLFVIAGFLEAFVTRLAGLPLLINMAIIILSLFFVIWYFVLYPSHINKLGDHEVT